MGEKYSSNCVSIPQGPINTIHDYRICQSNGVSIPQGPINTLFEIEHHFENLVSIPQGPINTTSFFVQPSFCFVSIPQGPINTDPFGRDTPGITLFQFRKVQLIRCQCIGKHGDVVSIPQGPINTDLLRSGILLKFVSIPQGPINTTADHATLVYDLRFNSARSN